MSLPDTHRGVAEKLIDGQQFGCQREVALKGGGKRVLRVAVMNPRTTERDVELTVRSLAERAERLSAE